MRSTLFLSLFALLFAFGCSAQNSNSISPDTDIQAESSNSLPIIACDNSTAIGVMGVYDLTMSPDKLTADLVPVRTSSLGESYVVSGAAFFTISPCADCLKIENISLNTDNNIVLGLSIKHPFPKGDIAKPPTAVNRLDLDVFDVALVVIPDDTLPTVYPLLGIDAYPGILVNANGYTTELTEIIDNAAYPFKICYEDENNNRFEMGTEYQPFDCVFSPDSGITFNLYLTMGYGASAKKPERLTPTYYVPEFNRKSAWNVDVTPPNGTEPPSINNTWNDADTTTNHDISIDVYDWNHGATIAATYPDETNTNHISASSDIGEVTVEVPGMTALPVTASTTDTTTNGWDDPITYSASFANENQLPAGLYHGIVSITDTRIPGTVVVGGETNTLVHTPEGIYLQWYGINKFVTYQTFPAAIVGGCGPITGGITSPTCPISGVTSGHSIEFSALASSENGGDPIVLYEWDIDYDGITFDIDATGSTADLGPFINPNCGTPPVAPVTYTVAVRATDSCTPPNVTVFDTCDVTVDNCSLGNLVLFVNRSHLSTRYPVDAAMPYTLEWTAATGPVAEYAIYSDHDPSDGLSNNFVEVGTTTATLFLAPPSELPPSHYVPGYTYVVRVRTVAGDPSSETIESELATVIVTGFETLPLWSTLDGEGWKSNAQGTDSNYQYSPFVTGANRAHGSRAVQFSRQVGVPAQTGLWNGITFGPTPDVPTSSVRFMSFSVDWRNVRDGGVIIGTCETQPTLGWTNPADEFDWSHSSTTYGLYGYTEYNDEICTYFNGCPSSGDNTWQINNSSFAHRQVGGDCNEFGDSSDEYVIIECLRTTPRDGDNYSNIFLDDVAIAIY